MERGTRSDSVRASLPRLLHIRKRIAPPQGLEVPSPLALSPGAAHSGRGLPHSKTLAREPMLPWFCRGASPPPKNCSRQPQAFQSRRISVSCIAIPSKAAEQRQMVAHGVSRGFEVGMMTSPGRGGRGERFKQSFLSLLRSLIPFHHPSHGSRRGLLSGATPLLAGRK